MAGGDVGRPGGPSGRASGDRGPSSHTRTLVFVARGTWPGPPFTHSPESRQSPCRWAPGRPASAAQSRVPWGWGPHSPAAPPQGIPRVSVALSPRTGDSAVRFLEGPAPNALLMQTGAQAACWAPPSPPAPAAPASPPGRPRARRFLLLLPLPFPGPALAEVLTAGSRGGGGAQMGLLSPPPPPPGPALPLWLGWAG